MFDTIVNSVGIRAISHVVRFTESPIHFLHRSDPNPTYQYPNFIQKRRVAGSEEIRTSTNVANGYKI